ncbi:hypothetical protein [Bacillus cereus]|uniref:hypothetical protein n=1 Tax=Bacillus cereus TaxID=1396 RepID=UPI0018F3B8C6|nr:hypothetical protein [Bacillus cereus]
MEKNPIATDEDYFKLSDNVYNDDYLHQGAAIEGANGKVWRVVESIDADKEKVNNGLQAIAVVPAKDYEPNKKHYENIIFAFRGTEFGKFDGDFTIDINQISIGNPKKYKLNTATQEVKFEPTSFDSSLEFVDHVNRTYKPTYIHATGHSKGAAEAHYVASERNFYATTYAAPNIYKLLSNEAKERVDSGELNNKIIDYTHKKDAVGNFTQFGAKMIGRQYTVKSNGTSHGLLGLLFMGEHPADTFKGMFHSNGNITLQLEPDEIIQQGKKLQTVSYILRDVIRNIEEFQRKEEEAIQKLKNQLKGETGPGGKYHLLEEYEVDDTIAEIAKMRQNGKDYFHNASLAEHLMILLQKELQTLSYLSDEICSAANSLRDKDQQLGADYKGLVGR